MQAIDIRRAYAAAALSAELHPGDLNELIPLFEALQRAERLGMDDFRNGVKLPPVMFHDAVDLLSAWKRGWDLAAGLAKVSGRTTTYPRGASAQPSMAITACSP